MFELFKEYLLRQVTLTDQELEMIRSASMPKKLRKKQYLLQEGEVAKYQAFVCKGFLRMYGIKDDGSEYILRFAPENWWITDTKSFDSGHPTTANIDAIEDSEVLLWPKAGFDQLSIDIPAFKAWREKMIEKHINAQQARINSNISQTTEEKYIHFIKSFPSIYNRVPLHMVASYLGLSAKTLVRIRQQFAVPKAANDVQEQ